MKSKIYWNRAERTILFNSLLAVFAKRPLLDKRVAINAAQDALPKHRRRKITANLAWVERNFVESARKAAQMPPTSNTITVKAAAGEVKLSHKDERIDSMLNQVADMMSDKILQRIQANLGAALSASEAPPVVDGA